MHLGFSQYDSILDNIFLDGLQNITGADERWILHVPSVERLLRMVPSFDINS